MTVDALIRKAEAIRLKSLKAIQKSGMKVVGSSMSAVEILVSLYYGDLGVRPVMLYDSDRPGWDGKDYAVLSKGDATAVLYAILADKGFFDEGELEFFAQVNSILQGRPNMKVPGVSMSVMNEGHGLSGAGGMALSLMMERKENRVFCVSDVAELQGGQFWEAATFAAHYKLNNLVLLVDDCGLQKEGTNRAIMDVGFIQTKLDSFGWQVYRVTDGHDFDQILNAMNKAFNAVRKPVCIWCQTVSGKGVDFAEGKPLYYDARLSENEYNQIVEKYE